MGTYEWAFHFTITGMLLSSRNREEFIELSKAETNAKGFVEC